MSNTQTITTPLIYNLAGAHLNPAVTLAMACAGRIAIIKVFFYMLAQYLGAFAAAASVLGVYSGMRQIALQNKVFSKLSPFPARAQMPSTM